jgi:asparagine synthase (glutamine-hydrolysing)
MAMCGITGWVDWQQDVRGEREILDRMTATLAQRGPDASGVYLSKHAAIGHRRLSVVDLEGGKQPMLRRQDERSYVITYNGELYNTDELRRELVSRGHVFNSASDTEVLLRSFMEWGQKCMPKLNGIFAFGVWDEKNESLFLARDRIGVKPLFYTQVNEKLIFGSELKALLAHPCVKAIINHEGLAELLMVGPARTPGHGVFKGINELKPGQMLVFDRQGIHIAAYWKLESQPHEDSFAKTVSTVRYLIEDAVKRQLVSDVPLCTLLSGGLDSSAITAIAAINQQQNGGGSLETFSVDYIDNEKYFTSDSFQPDADGPWARKVAAYYTTNHHEIRLETAELASALPAALVARDLPGMTDVDTSLYLFSREIRKLATVGLSGECADEVFGGYPWFYRQDMIQATTFPWAARSENRLSWLKPEVVRAIRAEEYLASRYSDAVAETPRLTGEDVEAARMREIFYLSLTRFMPTLLDRKDRMSMAFGLELRVPFCDHRLVEYVWNVPWAMKNYQNREKGLLRHALTGLLPDDVLWRKKSPYPKTHNPQFLEIVRQWALTILNDQTSPVLQLINPSAIRQIAEADTSTVSLPWFGQLMGMPQLLAYVIQLDSWLHEYHVSIE